jgi:hypothetical protein
VSDIQDAEAWNPVSSLISWRSYFAVGVWTVAQPLIDGLLFYPRWLALVQWLLGVGIIAGLFLRHRYRLAAPYRSKLAAVRADHPDSEFYGIRLDPLTTPVGVERGDSRAIDWGVLGASPDGIEIVRSNGEVLLHQPWSAIEFAIRGIDVRSETGTEEWWFQMLSDSGVWPRLSVLRVGRSHFERMQDLQARAAVESSHDSA